MNVAKNPFAGRGKKPEVEAAPAPIGTPVAVPEQDEKLKTKGIMFRLTPADWRRVKAYSTAREQSVQELLEVAFNMLLKSEGLEQIDGIPRGRK